MNKLVCKWFDQHLFTHLLLFTRAFWVYRQCARFGRGLKQGRAIKAFRVGYDNIFFLIDQDGDRH